MITYQVKAKDGSATVVNSDYNASTLGLNGVVTVASDIVKFDVSTIIAKLKLAADANTTVGTESFAAISNVQVILQDPSSLITGATSATVNLPLPKATFTDIGLGSIASVEGIKLISNSTLDMRAGSAVATAVANAVPTIGTIVSTANADLNTSKDLNTTVDTENQSGGIITVTKGLGTTNLILTVTTSGDLNEFNNTVSLSESATWITPVATSKIAAAAGSTVDFNLTIDGNLSTITAEETKIVSFSAVDEFGKSTAADTNISFFYNLAPVLTTKTPVVDENATVKYVGAITNVQSILDTNGTMSTCTIVAVNPNINTVGCSGTVTDSNLTVDMNDTTKTGWWVTLTLTDAYGATSVEYNATASGITATGN